MLVEALWRVRVALMIIKVTLLLCRVLTNPQDTMQTQIHNRSHKGEGLIGSGDSRNMGFQGSAGGDSVLTSRPTCVYV